MVVPDQLFSTIVFLLDVTNNLSLKFGYDAARHVSFSSLVLSESLKLLIQSVYYSALIACMFQVITYSNTYPGPRALLLHTSSFGLSQYQKRCVKLVTQR
jgi:hypothetical protein